MKKPEVQAKIQTSPSKGNLNLTNTKSAAKPAPSKGKVVEEDEISINPGNKEKRA